MSIYTFISGEQMLILFTVNWSSKPKVVMFNIVGGDLYVSPYNDHG